MFISWSDEEQKKAPDESEEDESVRKIATAEQRHKSNREKREVYLGFRSKRFISRKEQTTAEYEEQT